MVVRFLWSIVISTLALSSGRSAPEPARLVNAEEIKALIVHHEGKVVLLNFWATWCAPCRKEMPQLSELQTEFGGDTFEVLTIATGRNSPTGIKKFFEEIGVDNLPRHQDPRQKLAGQMAIFGLPITVLIDPEGREVARLRGDANWSSDTAKQIIATVLGQNPS